VGGLGEAAGIGQIDGFGGVGEQGLGMSTSFLVCELLGPTADVQAISSLLVYRCVILPQLSDVPAFSSKVFTGLRLIHQLM
jgi:hypothetical protein